MNEDYALQIANTAMEQLFETTPLNVLLSWGIIKMSATIFKDMGTLKLVVNGRLHKGVVLVSLNEGVDYYEIYLEKDGEMVKVAEDVDFESLGEVLDTAIEKGDDEAAYDQFCRSQLLNLL